MRENGLQKPPPVLGRKETAGSPLHSTMPQGLDRVVAARQRSFARPPALGAVWAPRFPSLPPPHIRETSRMSIALIQSLVFLTAASHAQASSSATHYPPGVQRPRSPRKHVARRLATREPRLQGAPRDPPARLPARGPHAPSPEEGLVPRALRLAASRLFLLGRYLPVALWRPASQPASSSESPRAEGSNGGGGREREGESNSAGRGLKMSHAWEKRGNSSSSAGARARGEAHAHPQPLLALRLFRSPPSSSFPCFPLSLPPLPPSLVSPSLSFPAGWVLKLGGWQQTSSARDPLHKPFPSIAQCQAHTSRRGRLPSRVEPHNTNSEAIQDRYSLRSRLSLHLHLTTVSFPLARYISGSQPWVTQLFLECSSLKFSSSAVLQDFWKLQCKNT
ncbi:regulator of G-protein signaling 17 isoform X4 [Pogona vitticeps]